MGRDQANLKFKEPSEDNIIKKIRDLFSSKSKAVKPRIIKHIKALFEHLVGNYYNLERFGNFWNNNYIKNERGSD